MSLIAVPRQPIAPRPLLRAGLPFEIAGWTGEDVTLGDGELANATSRLLNYDDYVYRVYRRADEEVWIYAMYWKQGSISVREIAGHTPDGCWIANGARYCAPKQTDSFRVGGRDTSPAEVREFAFSTEQRVRVLWWHIWGNDVVDREFDQKSLAPVLRELWVWLARRGGRKQDQMFIRIHTTGDLAKVMSSEPVSVFLRKFPEVFESKRL